MRSVPPAPDEIPVCHVVLSLDVGGVEKGVVTIVRGCRYAGIVSSVACVRRPGRLWSELPEGTPKVCIGGRRGPGPATVFRLVRFVRRSGAVILHTHNRAALVWGGLAHVFLPGVRLVHGHYGEDWPYRRVPDRFFLRRVVVFNTVCTGIGERLQRLNPGKEVRIIPNGVDASTFRPSAEARARLREQFDLPPDCFVFAAVGRLASPKNQATIIHAFAALAKEERPTRSSDSRLAMVLFGDGPDRPDLEALCNRLGVGGSVVFAGTRLDLPALLAGADVLLHPSLSEGMPNAVLEAAGCGLPIIASDIPAHRTLIRNGETGLLAPPVNVDEWRRAMVRLAADGELRRTFGRRAREDVMKRYPLHRMLEQYVDLYRTVAMPGPGVRKSGVQRFEAEGKRHKAKG